MLLNFPVALGFRKRTTTCPWTAYVHVCDYNCQCSSPPVASPRVHRRRAWRECDNRSVMGCKIKTDLCVKVLKWEDRCTGTIPPSRLGKSWSSGTENRYNGRLPGCRGWPGLLWVPHSALGHLLPPPSQPLDLQVISSAHSAGSQSSHAVGLAHPKSNSPRVSNPSATLTWFSRLAKAVARGVAAVACDSFEEPQAAQFLFQGFCARIPEELSSEGVCTDSEAVLNF